MEKLSSNQKESVQELFPLRFGSVVTSGVGGSKNNCVRFVSTLHYT